ncbi:MAG: ligase protein [Candidatus Gottesmanbacteria bacterium GW2011_GWB1_49_7]|uniref:DNA ligase (NAD(+)) n=1 Tax=Candidatus Gottesmanbacteria bacterium GW2011_GWB1_49_7 TaxID=1618448 RepID=A0A0G1Y6B4_9BACT|nr:MAG: ligase protein [Candidatus Gottesmanbacteria bacterium GW2011_GWB1_49_7]
MAPDFSSLLSADLVEQLIEAREGYYSHDSISRLSDTQYDAMVEELSVREPQHPFLSQIGHHPISGKKVQLDHPLYSLDKVKTPQEFEVWWNRQDKPFVVISSKYDGVAVDLKYRYCTTGRVFLVQACTRGDGTVGEDVTAQVLHGNIKGLLLSFTPPLMHGPLLDSPQGGDEFHVYGELVISRQTLHELNLVQVGRGHKRFSNTRNLANATIGLQDLEEIKRRKLQFFAYNMSTPIDLHRKLYFLSGTGFGVVDYVTCGRAAPTSNIPTAYVSLQWSWSKDRSSEPFDCDGMVVAISSFGIQQRLGYTSHHPRWAVAVKYPDDTAVVTVKKLEWTVSKTGTITPQIVYDPVFLGGAELERCTLHNVAHVIDYRIVVGTVVELCRSGGVIPKFLRVVSDAISTEAVPHEDIAFGLPTPLYPSHCPSCGQPLKLELPDLKCYHPTCQAQLAMRLEHFLDAIDFKGIGEKTCDILVQSGALPFLESLWTLDASAMSTICGWSIGHAATIVEDLERIKQSVPFAKLLLAFQIPRLGRSAAKKIASRYDNPEVMFSKIHSGDAWWTSELGPNVGFEIRQDLLQYSTSQWQRLKSVGFIVARPTPKGKDGLIICLTGTLMIGREDYRKLIDASGHIFTNSLTRDVKYLVVGADAGSGKSAKAAKYGTAIVDETWLRNLLGL